jgi:DNA processing protein
VKKIHKDTDDYPKNLKGLADAPELIYCEGNLSPNDNVAVAIVGTRTPTRYGIEVANEFAYQLAVNGITIVSGMARGIDTIAHKAALNVGGRTIAVLANGLDIIYPPENESLFKQIAQNGAVISEHRPGTRPLPKNFLARNRLISGLSLAVLVVEGRRRSGTLSTATHAANQGREVFAIPGPVNSKQSEAPLYLIEQGANVAKTPQDILDLLI